MKTQRAWWQRSVSFAVGVGLVFVGGCLFNHWLAPYLVVGGLLLMFLTMVVYSLLGKYDADL